VSYKYRLFGFSAVSNLPIPSLVPSANLDPDLHIFFGSGPGIREQGPSRETLTYTSAMILESGNPAFRVFTAADRSVVHFLYDDGREFWLDDKSQSVWARWPETLSLSDAAEYLLGPILGVLMRRKGIACLHASAVSVNGKAVLFAGDAGAGKSTTAAAMARRGHAVLSDDVVAIAERDGQFFATPAYPYIALWPESVEMLYGAGAELPALSDNSGKQQLSLECNAFQESVLPIGAIFVLGQRISGSSAPQTEELTPKEGLLALIANSYATRLMDVENRAKELALFGRMLRSVRLQRLRASSDPQHIERLCDAIADLCKAL
jgi:hypothetical protein